MVEEMRSWGRRVGVEFMSCSRRGRRSASDMPTHRYGTLEGLGVLHVWGIGMNWVKTCTNFQMHINYTLDPGGTSPLVWEFAMSPSNRRSNGGVATSRFPRILSRKTS